MTPVSLLLKDVEEAWRNAFKAIRDGFAGQDRMAQFLRHYWIAERKFVRMQALYREIAAWLKGPDRDPSSPKGPPVLVTPAVQRQRLTDLAGSLRDSAGRYVWLAGGDEGEAFDPTTYIDSEQYLSAIAAFGATQVLPLLLAIINRSPEAVAFKSLSRSVEAMIIRRALVDAAPNDVEQAVGLLCRQFVEGALDVAGVAAVIDKLASEKQTADTFKMARLPPSEARYILLALENEARTKTSPPRMPMPYDPKKLDVEHILPETTAGSGWNEAEWGPDIEAYKNRLGNYALLERGKNRAAKNAVYFCKSARPKIGPRGVVCCKKHSYEKNKDIELTTQIANDFRAWNPRNLERQSAKLAALAEERWPLKG